MSMGRSRLRFVWVGEMKTGKTHAQVTLYVLSSVLIFSTLRGNQADGKCEIRS